MSITTILPPFTTTPNRNQPATFSADTDTYHEELTPFVPLLNTWTDEANTLAEEINDNKDIVIAAKNETLTAKDIAVASANYKGDWAAGSYNQGESVSYTDGFNYQSKINNNTDEPPTANWLQIPKSLIINDSVVNTDDLWSSFKINQVVEDGLSEKVDIDGNQTINDTKTFSSSPIAPTPATADSSTKVATTEHVQNNKIEIATTAEAQSGVDNTKAITPLRLREGLNAQGLAPVLALRAKLRYNGITNTVIEDINISSVVDLGNSIFQVNLSSPIPTTNYTVLTGASRNLSSSSGVIAVVTPFLYTTTSFRIETFRTESPANDIENINLAIV